MWKLKSGDLEGFSAGAPSFAPREGWGLQIQKVKGKNLAFGRFGLFLARREAAEDLRDLLGHFARLGERLELLVNVCRVSLFTRSDSADTDKLLHFVDSHERGL